MQKITPFLWFDGNAEEAVQFYLSVFKDGKIHSTTRFPEGSPGDNQPGTVMTIAFELKGQQFVALNGGWIRPQISQIHTDFFSSESAEWVA
jgi:predicted 3-demethylubiquinone-9 3-methyltransferase (glyoxalase superfamily)